MLTVDVGVAGPHVAVLDRSSSVGLGQQILAPDASGLRVLAGGTTASIERVLEVDCTDAESRVRLCDRLHTRKLREYF